MKKSFLRRGASLPKSSASTVLATGLVLGGAVLAQGCLQRDVNPQKPNTSNVFVDKIANDKIDKIDLLFVIDNSVSMADKQAILAKAVPQMVERLVNPLCVDAEGENPVQNPGTGPEGCPAGTTPEFQAIDDIHIGVISSSLGGHGSRSCLPGVTYPATLTPQSPTGFYDNDDKGHLIPTVRKFLDQGVNNLGFLAWNGGGEAERATLVDLFTKQVVATGEYGCGFEAPLEAWYRFLIDPTPPLNMVLDDRQRAVADGLDTELLAQREAFLRPSGLVAIVVLTDENDCSIMDGGTYYDNASYGYLIAKTQTTPAPPATPQTALLPVATAMCETNPNDKCCFSCLQGAEPPSGCESQAAICGPDPQKAPVLLARDLDRANVRCFQNKRRFGVDLLYPTQRYVDALTQPELINARDNTTFPNPLLTGAGESNKGKQRDAGLVFFAGVVGIPWQDVATADSLDPASPVMNYLTAAELSSPTLEIADRKVDRWEVILGQPGIPVSSRSCDVDRAECGQVPVPPLDPFMIESIAPRTAGLLNPISNDQIVDYNSNDPRANNINGHEANHNVVTTAFNDPSGPLPANDDLQYACTFPLEDTAVKMDCVEGQGNCDCGDELTATRNRPLCQPVGGGPAEINQYWGKAYPGTRILQVLKDFGANSIVGSICPKITTGDPQAPGFGYNPAVQAIIDRLAEKLTGKCLPRPLSIDEETGEVPCSVVEAKPRGSEEPLNCDPANGRGPVDALTQEAVIAQLRATKVCDLTGGVACADFEMCVIEELSGGDAGREDCLTNPGDPATFANKGFCYVDPAKQNSSDEYIAGGPASEPLVAKCPATQRRLLRFVGDNTPAAQTVTFVACTGEAVSEDSPIPSAPEPTLPEEEAP